MIQRFADFELDRDRHELRAGDQPVPLQPRVLALLFYLVEHRDRVVAKNELLDEVWAGAIVVEAALTRAISVLRSTLGDSDRDRRLIVTVPGIGYRFAADVEQLADEARPRPSAPATSSPAVPPAVAERREVLERPALAILPFANLSSDPEQDYFVEGITDELTTALSCWRRFPVIGRRSASSCAGESLGLREIAEKLEARYVLEGSVRRAGERLRISAELSDASTDRTLWAQRYERKIGDVFALQDEICEQIVRGIEPELTRAEIERARRKAPESLDAWDCALRAASQLHAGGPERLARARALLDEAVSLDPHCPHVHALIALHLFDEALAGQIVDPRSQFARARAAAAHACQIDPRDWLAKALLGITTLWVDGDHARAIELVEEAVDLNPSGTRAYQFLACVLEFAGRLAEAAEALETVLRLDPILQSQALLRADLALCHMLLGEHEVAVQHCEQALRSDPENPRALQRLAAALGHLGEQDRGAETLDALSRAQPGFGMDYLAATYPFRDPAHFEFLVEGLVRAGWNDKAAMSGR